MNVVIENDGPVTVPLDSSAFTAHKEVYCYGHCYFHGYHLAQARQCTY